MSIEIMDCRDLFKEIKQRLRAQIEEFGKHAPSPEQMRPRVLIATCTDDEGTVRYLRNKCRDFTEVGIEYIVQRFSPRPNSEIVLDAVRMANKSPVIHGIMIQLPFDSPHREYIIDAIDVKKDIDGLTAMSTGYHWSSRLYGGYRPCTPLGVQAILKHWDIPVTGRNVCIINRSNVVGKPLAKMMLDEGACVTICHSKIARSAIVETMRRSDIVISAIGQAYYWTVDDVAPGSVLIDVGINSTSNHILCGDFAPECATVASTTPVPGGVGLMTRAMLLQNIVDAWKGQLSMIH